MGMSSERDKPSENPYESPIGVEMRRVDLGISGQDAVAIVVCQILCAIPWLVTHFR